MQLIIGFLGMPREYDAFARAGYQHLVNVTTVGSLLAVTILFLLGGLCFNDLFGIMREMRAHPDSSTERLP